MLNFGVFWFFYLQIIWFFKLLIVGIYNSLSSTVILSTLLLINNSSFESYYHTEDTVSLDAKTKTNLWNITVGAGLSYRL